MNAFLHHLERQGLCFYAIKTVRNMFSEVASRYDGPKIERSILEFWRREDVFAAVLAQGRGKPQFVFYEGPPTANGRPGIHHVLARTFKDLFPRYKTMRGYHCERKAGWDTHGLPVEHEVEKVLGIYDKRRIEKEVGIAQFNALCRESVMRYVADWEVMTERMGFWVDLQHAYFTLHNDYIESVWYLLKQLWDRGLIYQGYKVVPYDPRIGATLSSHEVALGYRDVEENRTGCP
jgi:isoleucyl-tRNA synthetase